MEPMESRHHIPPTPGPAPFPPEPFDPDKQQYEDGKIWDDIDDDQDWQTNTGRPWDDLGD